MHYWVIVTRDIQSPADSHVAITPTHAHQIGVQVHHAR